MERIYNLNGFLIFAQEHSTFADFFIYTWSKLSGERKYWGDKLRCKVFVDKKNDITFLTNWRSDRFKKPLGNLEKSVEYLNYVPDWDKTRYWMVIDRFGAGPLLDCRTGKPVRQLDLYC